MKKSGAIFIAVFAAGLLVSAAAASAQSYPAIHVSTRQFPIRPGQVLKFPNIRVGSAGDPLVITLLVVGQTPLTIKKKNAISITEGDSSVFSIDLSHTDRTLSPGEGTTFKVDFRPKSPGQFSATIAIVGNGLTVPAFSFKVSGNGV